MLKNVKVPQGSEQYNYSGKKGYQRYKYIKMILYFKIKKRYQRYEYIILIIYLKKNLK